jgi:endonuclease YncB( thermonuclease family)
VYDIISKGKMVANLPTINGRYATAGEAISDGDTLYASAEGLLSVRFCSIDTPEMGLPLNKNDVFEDRYYPTEDFEDYLKDPFNRKYPNSDEFIRALGEDFVENYIKPKLKDKPGINHKTYAEKAREGLKRLVEDDIRQSINFGKDYKFEIEFPYEAFDRFGRFLGWVKRFESKEEFAKRIVPYNDSIVGKGLAFPYFIWPNLSISKRDYNLQQLVPYKEDFKEWILQDPKIKNIRDLAQKAREKRLGVFSTENKDLLMPFELRFLVERNYSISDNLPVSFVKQEDGDDRSHKRPLFRYVINMSKHDNPVLMKPNQYHKIENFEDRLFIPPEYVSLFKDKGYEIQS